MRTRKKVKKNEMRFGTGRPWEVVLCALRVAAPDAYHHEIECTPWTHCEMPLEDREAGRCPHLIPVMFRDDIEIIRKHFYYLSRKKPKPRVCGNCSLYPCTTGLRMTDPPCEDYIWKLTSYGIYRPQWSVYCTTHRRVMNRDECYTCYISRDRNCRTMKKPFTIAYKGLNLDPNGKMLYDFVPTLPHEYLEFARAIMRPNVIK